MTFSDNSSLCSSNQTDDRVFILEVIGLRSMIATANPSNPIRQSGPIEVRVPYARMNQEMRRIKMQGGEIASVRPLGTEARLGDSSQKELAWWLKVSTQQPKHQFYFGRLRHPSKLSPSCRAMWKIYGMKVPKTSRLSFGRANQTTQVLPMQPSGKQYQIRLATISKKS